MPRHDAGPIPDECLSCCLPSDRGPGALQKKNLRKKRRPKTFIPGRTCMFSANDSWLSNFVHGRSSDLAIDALLRLPGHTPSDMHGAKLPPYSDEFVQDLHLLPFSPGHEAQLHPGHRGRSVHLSSMIAQAHPLVNGNARSRSRSPQPDHKRRRSAASAEYVLIVA